MEIVRRLGKLNKKYVIVGSIFLGLFLFLYSYYLSYPLLMDSVDDFVYNHISPIYWIGLFIILPSLFILATISDRNDVKLISCIGIIFFMYSIKFFYYSFPASDIHYVRGLIEYVLTFEDLDPTKVFHEYYQWPIFFIINQIFILITNINLRYTEYILFIIFGVIYVSSLYLYYYYNKKSIHISIIAFLLIIYWFFNYQYAPFSLAMSLLFILYMIESNEIITRNHVIISIFIYMCIIFTHPFAAIFYINYVMIMYILYRNKKHLQLFLFTLLIYTSYNLYYAKFFIPVILYQLESIDIFGYSTFVERTFSGRVIERPFIDIVSQIFSRVTVIFTLLFTGVGFLLILMKKKFRQIDIALFISSVIIIIVGVLVPLIGIRVVFSSIIPMSIGINYFYNSKYKKITVTLFFILIMLFPFIPLTQSFYDRQIMYQTENEYIDTNFFINHHDWSRTDTILSHFRLSQYLKVKTSSSTLFLHDLRPDFPDNIENSDYIIYSVGLGKTLLSHNYSLTTALEENMYNRMYDSHYSYISVKSSDQ